MAVVEVTGNQIHSAEIGIRPFDIGRDLRPVAELIADAFSDDLDPRGKAALREMRIMSHVSGLVKLVNRSTGEFNNVFSGFVWQEDGRIVGNVTVQRVDRYGSRWQIANVAVDREYRGRGISRQLMDEALGHIEASRGQWAVLQVYKRNDAARNLYASLDFEDVGGVVDLRLAAVPDVAPPDSSPGFAAFSSHHSTKLYELANAQLNSEAQWWRAVRRSDFETPFDQQLTEWLWRRLGRATILRRSVQTARRFEAAIVLAAQGWSGEHELDMWVRPEHYGQYEKAMTEWALSTLQGMPSFPVVAKLSTSHEAGVQALSELGFQPDKTLITLRRRVRD